MAAGEQEPRKTTRLGRIGPGISLSEVDGLLQSYGLSQQQRDEAIDLIKRWCLCVLARNMHFYTGEL